MTVIEAAGHALPTTLLPPRVIDRLRREGITTLEAWRALGPRRKQIFGITGSMVKEIDIAARARSPAKTSRVTAKS